MAQVGTSTGDARHWAAINEATCVAGMRLLFWVCRTFGRWPFRVVLYPVLLWYVATQPRARRASAAYLARVDMPAGVTGVLRHFGAFAEAILDKMLLWGGGFDFDRVRLHGAEPLIEASRRGRGALLVCAHLGNLDLCRALSLRTPGLRVTVLVHTKHAQAFNDVLAQLDPKSRLNLMQVTDMDAAMAMQLSERRIKELGQERKPLTDEAEFYKGKPLPPKLKQGLDANDASVEAQQQLIDNQKAEIVRINTRFDAELARLKKLWAGAAPGTLPPLNELPKSAPATTPSAPRR